MSILSKKNVKDYHSNFNSERFHHWWSKKLLPALKRFKNQEFCIILDNAKYHCSYGPDDENRNIKTKKKY